MSEPSHTIVDMAEVWDELTPRQQMFMIQRAKALAAHNMMQAKGITFEDLQNAVSEASAPSDTMVCVLHLSLKSERKKQ